MFIVFDLKTRQRGSDGRGFVECSARRHSARPNRATGEGSIAL